MTFIPQLSNYLWTVGYSPYIYSTYGRTEAGPTASVTTPGARRTGPEGCGGGGGGGGCGGSGGGGGGEWTGSVALWIYRRLALALGQLQLTLALVLGKEKISAQEQPASMTSSIRNTVP